MISNGIVILWLGAHIDIPAGYVRATELDGRYPKGAADEEDAGEQLGSNTHSHTSPSHTHTIKTHQHTGTTTRDGSYQDDGGSTHNASRDAHYHAFTSNYPQGGDLVGACDYQSVNHEPPFYEVVFIKAVGDQAIPVNSAVLFNGDTIPSEFEEVAALVGNFIKGATSPNDAGGVGGNVHHNHVVNHSHSPVSHTHGGDTQGPSDSVRDYNTTPGGGSVVPIHTHALTLNSNTPETGPTYGGAAGSAETVEPEYTKLAALKNTSAVATLPQLGFIGMWLGDRDTIPAGWKICDGDNDTVNMLEQYLKIGEVGIDIGDTGGDNAHTHAASNSHSHNPSTTANHTHTASFDSKYAEGSTGTSSNGASNGHTHSLATLSTATTEWNNATIQANESSNELARTKVIFIEYVYTPIAAPLNDVL